MKGSLSRHAVNKKNNQEQQVYKTNMHTKTEKYNKSKKKKN